MIFDALLSRAGRMAHDSFMTRALGAGEERDVIALGLGMPAEDVFPWHEFKDAARELLTGRDPRVLQYEPPGGLLALREWLVGFQAERGIHASVDEILLTSGSQQALDVVARALVDPGDVVLVDLPSYPGAMSVFAAAGAQLVGLRNQFTGVDLNDLEAVCERLHAKGQHPKLLYQVPNFQNPSGFLLSLEKRRALLAWAERNQVIIVEDDPYGDLFFEDLVTRADTRPMKADDVEGVVVYIGSFSKTLSPAVRVGWITAQPALTRRLEAVKYASDLGSSGLGQRLVCDVLKMGMWPEHSARLRWYYQNKRDVMEQAIARTMGPSASWPRPRGGFYLWVDWPEPLDTASLQRRARDYFVSYSPGRAFLLDGTGGNTMRLSFSHAQPHEIEEGILRLGQAIQDEINGVRLSPQ